MRAQHQRHDEAERREPEHGHEGEQQDAAAGGLQRRVGVDRVQVVGQVGDPRDDAQRALRARLQRRDQRLLLAERQRLLEVHPQLVRELLGVHVEQPRDLSQVRDADDDESGFGIERGEEIDDRADADREADGAELQLDDPAEFGAEHPGRALAHDRGDRDVRVVDGDHASSRGDRERPLPAQRLPAGERSIAREFDRLLGRGLREDRPAQAPVEVLDHLAPPARGDDGDVVDEEVAGDAQVGAQAVGDDEAHELHRAGGDELDRHHGAGDDPLVAKLDGGEGDRAVATGGVAKPRLDQRSLRVAADEYRHLQRHRIVRQHDPPAARGHGALQHRHEPPWGRLREVVAEPEHLRGPLRVDGEHGEDGADKSPGRAAVGHGGVDDAGQRPHVGDARLRRAIPVVRERRTEVGTRFVTRALLQRAVDGGAVRGREGADRDRHEQQQHQPGVGAR